MTAVVQRLPDWALRFDALITARQRMPFQWGVNDCAIFAADAVLAMTGVDLAAGLRGLGVRQALRTVRRAGGLCFLVPDALPLLRTTSQAVEGDVALLVRPGASPKRLAFGVVNCAGMALGPSRAGLVAVPMHHAVQCWGVGHG